MSVALEFFSLDVAVTMPSFADLSVLILVGGWGKPSSWIVMRRGTAVWTLWNSPPFLIRLRTPPRVLGFYTPCGLGHFLLAVGLKIFPVWLVVILGSSSVQCGCGPMVLMVMMYCYQCEVSYCYIYIRESRTDWWLHSLETVFFQLQYI